MIDEKKCYNFILLHITEELNYIENLILQRAIFHVSKELFLNFSKKIKALIFHLKLFYSIF